MKIKEIFKKSIPSIITGAADNDPSGISTYSIVGAQFGYGLNWLMIIATPMLIAVEAMCSRLSDVKRQGLTAIIKDHFPKPVVFVSVAILLIANVATIGADLAGMAAALELIIGSQSILYIFAIALIVWAIVFFGNFRLIQKYLLWMVLFSFAYILAAFLAKPDWLEVVVKTILPTISLNFPFFAAVTAILGTTISPYLFFWESSESVEAKEPKYRLLRKARFEDRTVAPGFIVSNLISLFIMIATGTVLFSNGITDIRDATSAASSLEPLAGPFAKYVFAVGLIGAGFLAVPILATTTAYAVSEAFGWRESLSAKLDRAKGFYAIIFLSIITGILIAVSGIDPIKSLFYSQILVGLLTPFLVLLILLLCNNKNVMGKFTNGWFDNVFGILTFVAMLSAGVGFFWQFFS